MINKLDSDLNKDKPLIEIEEINNEINDLPLTRKKVKFGDEKPAEDDNFHTAIIMQQTLNKFSFENQNS